jgi:anti-sigma regulatory factor (Ser/Thr protein kinase)
MIEIDVADDSAVAAARRSALAAGAAVGLDDVRAGQLALIATELATNLLKHGGGGKMLVGNGHHHVDLLALDKGRGMKNVDQCLADGFSTVGTPGNGLGAVQRLAQAFHVASWPDRGTAVSARVVTAGRRTAAIRQRRCSWSMAWVTVSMRPARPTRRCSNFSVGPRCRWPS